jgi:hypothetical protein
MSTDEQLAADPAMLGQHQTDVEIHSECRNNSAPCGTRSLTRVAGQMEEIA